MTFCPLMFTGEDALLIHHGLEERHSRPVSSRSAGVLIDRTDEIWARKERSLPVP
jgi:hypothetical protein